MTHSSLHTFARLFVIAVATVTLAACSNESPVSPGGAAASGSLDAKPSSGGVPGVYDLTFWASFAGVGWQEVSSLPVLSKELLLKARVTDTSGNPATAGSVTFDYCSYGKPTNDITNPDEAPMEACEQGAAKWSHWLGPVALLTSAAPYPWQRRRARISALSGSRARSASVSATFSKEAASSAARVQPGTLCGRKRPEVAQCGRPTLRITV